MLTSKAIHLACLATFLYVLASLTLLVETQETDKKFLIKVKEVVLDAFNVSQNILDCSDLHDNVVFYMKPKQNGSRTIGPLHHSNYYNVTDNILYFTDLKDLIDNEVYDYYCELLGGQQHVKFLIKIMPRARALVTTQTVTIGSFKDLTCRLESGNETTTQWQWYKNDELIVFENQTRYSIKGTKHQSILSLREVQADDEGHYTCTLINNYGNSSSVIHVQINSVFNVLLPFFICSLVVIGLILFFCFIERRSERKND